jgi:serine/threonine protein kinase
MYCDTFIHERLARHMDIKPQNILVRRLSGRLAQVYITDFGSSTQYLSEEEAETDGFSPFTRHYAAQEVVLQEPRGFPADIFSLGCVFLEMQTAVLGSSYADLDEHLKRDTRRVPYHRNGIAINAFIERLSNHPRSLNGLQIPQRKTKTRLKTIKAMLNEGPSERPLAVGIALGYGANECCHLERENLREGTSSGNQASGE